MGRRASNTVPISSVPPRPMKRRKATTSVTPNESTQSVDEPSGLRTFSLVPKIQSRPSIEQSKLTLTSPSTERTSQKRSNIELRQHSHNSETNPAMSVSQPLIAPGSSHDPIVLAEGSPKAKDRASNEINRVETNRDIDRYSMMLPYEVPRTAIATTLAIGTPVTGRPGCDTYHVRAAKLRTTAQHASRSQQVQLDVQLQTRYPAPKQYFAVPKGIEASPTRPAFQYFGPSPQSFPHHATAPPGSEEELRRKARQDVQEYSRTALHKRKKTALRNSSSTSESKSESVDLDRSVLVPESNSDSAVESSTFTISPDPPIQLAPIIDQASLLTSLLQMYPRSTNQAGLREDIAMLASIQNQHLTDWLNFENGRFRRTADLRSPRAGRRAITSPVKPKASRVRIEAAKRKEQDDKIRGLLSASAELWQDGSGVGVADVYAETRSSTLTSDSELQ
ncbi:hypothetical protein SVAN01_08728 [Stagonosporopsis vannaccii]|nr:hypothetical protein SVAN01_08728 [Stagonosporopsis vannaccii]